MAGCKFADVDYSEGALICSNGRELKCSGGEWIETGYSCQTSGDDASVYLRISPAGDSVEITGEIE